MDILTWVVWDPYKTSCWLVSIRVFSHLLGHKCNDLRGPRADPPHPKKKQGQAEISPCLLLRSLSFTHSHAHTLIHRHNHTVSSISVTSQQQVFEDRGHLCTGLPLFSSASGHLCWEKTGREEQPKDRLSAPTSTPPRYKISLVRMHLLWHPDPTLTASPFSQLFSSYSLLTIFFLVLDIFEVTLYPNLAKERALFLSLHQLGKKWAYNPAAVFSGPLYGCCSLATASLPPSGACPLPLCLLAPVFFTPRLSPHI